MKMLILSNEQFKKLIKLNCNSFAQVSYRTKIQAKAGEWIEINSGNKTLGFIQFAGKFEGKFEGVPVGDVNTATNTLIAETDQKITHCFFGVAYRYENLKVPTKRELIEFTKRVTSHNALLKCIDWLSNGLPPIDEFDAEIRKLNKRDELIYDCAFEISVERYGEGFGLVTYEQALKRGYGTTSEILSKLYEQQEDET